MIKICFTKKTQIEEGLRIIVLSGTVVYPGEMGVYQIPNYMLNLLDKNQIAYKIIKYRSKKIRR